MSTPSEFRASYQDWLSRATPKQREQLRSILELEKNHYNEVLNDGQLRTQCRKLFPLPPHVEHYP